MSDHRTEERKKAEVLHFPASNEPAQENAAWERAVLAAFLDPLRGRPSWQSVVAASGGDHERVESLLRSSGPRGRVAESTAAHLLEMIPLAMKSFAEAIEEKQGWAIKLLFDAIGFERIAGGMLEDSGEGADVVISTAFEQDVIKRVLSLLRGQIPPARVADSAEE